MIVIVLIIIGIAVFLMFENGNSEPEKVRPHRPKDADKEFEDMYFNGASGDDIDDF